MIGITMIKMEINAQVGFMLKINGILLTSAGKKEGAKRQKIMIDFLAERFGERPAWDEPGR